MSGKAGQRKRVALGPEHALSRMWKSMRMLRVFTTADLEATAEVSYNHAKKYVRALGEAEYLVMAQPRKSGVTGGHASYRLVRNTGPVAPRFAIDGLFDANLADPYQLPPSKKISRHAHALHKALRELVDVASDDDHSPDINPALDRARETLRLCDQDVRR
jgi:hypothetical protein